MFVVPVCFESLLEIGFLKMALKMMFSLGNFEFRSDVAVVVFVNHRHTNQTELVLQLQRQRQHLAPGGYAETGSSVHLLLRALDVHCVKMALWVGCSVSSANRAGV